MVFSVFLETSVQCVEYIVEDETKLCFPEENRNHVEC